MVEVGRRGLGCSGLAGRDHRRRAVVVSDSRRLRASSVAANVISLNSYRAPMQSAEPSSALLTLLRNRVQVTQRLVHAGDLVYASGSPFTTLFVVTRGALKTTRDCLDGRTRVAALHLSPDWLGFDG